MVLNSQGISLSDKEVEFILSHKPTETDRLLLSAGRYPDINVPLCVNSIIARKKLEKKVPEWSANPKLVYPSLLPLEQCSSWLAAKYKADIISSLLYSRNVTDSITGADLTGGLGIDSFYLSAITDKFHYYERESSLCNAALNNFHIMGVDKIEVSCMEINNESFLSLPGNLTFIYIDPARREKSGTGKKVISITEYQPDITEIKENLLSKCEFALIKLSPMVDIKQCMELLPETLRVDVVAIGGECKELLFLLMGGKWRGERAILPLKEIPVNAVDLQRENCRCFSFTYSQEEKSTVRFASEIDGYLLQPGKEILKAGAFKSIATVNEIEKIAPATHLYLCKDENISKKFQGKAFKIESVIPFNKAGIKTVAEKYPGAEISARNFPLDTNALEKRLSLKKRAESPMNPPHIFAVTTLTKERVLIVTKAIS